MLQVRVGSDAITGTLACSPISFMHTDIMWAILYTLASIIAGECPGGDEYLPGKLAVAHVYYNRVGVGMQTELGGEGWFGRAEPGPVDLLVAATWWQHEDPTDGAVFLLGPGDKSKLPWVSSPGQRFQCGGSWVRAWGY